MKRASIISATLLLSFMVGVSAHAQQRKPSVKPTARAKTPARTPAAKKEPAGEDAQKAELDEIVKLAPQERIERLKVFIRKASPDSPLALRAREFLTSARAAYGDEKLRTNDRLAGAELFREAVAEAPAAMSDKLFVEVVAQLPANLYVLGEREAARDLALAVEEKAKGNARRLLTVAAFYLSTEQADEAARVASAAVALEPELAAAHQALGAAHRVSLRLEDAATEYARALELDPKSAASRRSLADLRRATGKSEEALALYREQLAADPQDANARAGLVVSLFDLGRREEAERELDAGLAERPSNLPLLVGAAYWYAANGAGARAVELAERAVALEPRYRWVWARVALARALLAQGKPLEAERALRPARELGSFPTLDYELASVLAAAGLYEEAARELARSFTIRGGQIETNLAGRFRARAEDFNELLAPERRAGLFQFKGAEGARQARILKSLLAFHLAAGDGENFDERAAAEAAREFASGDDGMRSFRHMYAAGRLLRRGAALDAVLERAEAAKGGVEAALALPVAPVALFAEELAEVRARAISEGATTTVPNVPREMLSKIMRGRIEELSGWALYNQGQTAEAVVRLRRAVSVLPENTIWWRTAEWRLGAALEASGNSRDALSAYVKSYLLGPDPTRRAVIEALYKKLNKGSLKGLDELLGTSPDTASLAPPAATATPEATTPATEVAAPSPETTPTPEPTPTPAPPATPTPEAAATPTPEATPMNTPAPTPSTTERAEPTPTPSPLTPEATPSPSPTSTPTPEPSPEATPTATPEPTPTPSPTPSPASTPATVDVQGAVPSSTPAPTPEAASGPRPTRTRRGGGASACTISLSESSLTIKKNGGGATLSVNFENFNGPAPPRVNPSTANWADIVVLAEPRAEADGNASRFTVSSTSTKTGTFVVNFNSPCGKQSVTVNVE